MSKQPPPPPPPITTSTKTTNKISYSFTGLMAPVFTAFADSTDASVRLDCIDAYASHLAHLGVGAVLVNGTTGEGPSLTLRERVETAESWRRACNQNGMSMMLQIGGAAVADVNCMALHAKKIGVDAVLLLPDLFFRPRTEAALVEYCRRVAAFCPHTPMLYYHIPSMTEVNLNMPRFLDAAEAAIPNFCGLKYTAGDLGMGAECLRPGRRSVFLGADTILCGALALGFDSACLTTLNIWPQLSASVMQSMTRPVAGEQQRVVNVYDAQMAQRELSGRVTAALQVSGDWVADMKLAMDAELVRCGASFRLGKRVRRPRMI